VLRRSLLMGALAGRRSGGNVVAGTVIPLSQRVKHRRFSPGWRAGPQARLLALARTIVFVATGMILAIAGLLASAQSQIGVRTIRFALVLLLRQRIGGGLPAWRRPAWAQRVFAARRRSAGWAR
jgi:hypothetical protein